MAQALKKTKRSLAVSCLYLVVAVALTYPLVGKFTTTIVGRSHDHEEATFSCNLWWTRFSLLELHQNPFTTDYVFAPFTVDLRMHNFAPLYGLLSIPVQPLWGAAGALNALILITVALNGYTVYLLAREVLEDDAGALIAGTLVAAGPALTFHLRAGKPSFAAV